MFVAACRSATKMNDFDIWLICQEPVVFEAAQQQYFFLEIEKSGWGEGQFVGFHKVWSEDYSGSLEQRPIHRLRSAV